MLFVSVLDAQTSPTPAKSTMSTSSTSSTKKTETTSTTMHKTESAPMATEKSKSEPKEHVCTAACKDGKHAYAHGEKGHTCTAACHKSHDKPAAKAKAVKASETK